MDTLETVQRLTRLETKLDFVLEAVKNPAVPKMVDERIKTLETRQNIFIGGLAALNGVYLLFQDKIASILNLNP